MKFGVFFPHQLPRPWAEGSEADLIRDGLDVIELSDRLGVQYAWAQEHHFLEEYSHSTAPEVFLAAASQRTRRIRLGHGVTIMLPAVNHPARIAERLATLDIVSGGRLEWGTGEMSSHVELGGFQVNYVEKRSMWAEAVRETALMMSTTPYPGYSGKHFAMPPRNVVPKPIQRPHPPLWIACTNRETLRMAARVGAGALTFAFMGPEEAKFWVEEYYDIFRRECVPIGQAVNPNVAALIGFYCSEDSERVREEALRDQRFFKYGLAHYYRFGRHIPGQTDIWGEFERAPETPMAGLDGVGPPARLIETFKAYEAAGVDQLILLQQAGRLPTDRICESLDLFGRRVIEPFVERDDAQVERKRDALSAFVETALARRPAAGVPATSEVEAYPALWERAAAPAAGAESNRAIEASSLWNLHVGGARS